MFDLLSEFNRIMESLQGTRIRYALIGGLAVAVHGGVRSTEDIDFLVHPDDIQEFIKNLRSLNYSYKNPPWNFVDSGITVHRLFRCEPEKEDLYVVDLLSAVPKDHQEMIRRAIKQPWAHGELSVLQPADLIEMKKKRLSDSDRADINVLENRNDKAGE